VNCGYGVGRACGEGDVVGDWVMTQRHGELDRVDERIDEDSR
jgi:hypothetical protein